VRNTHREHTGRSRLPQRAVAEEDRKQQRAAEFRREKRLYYGKDSRVATASLSRAYQRLEDRQYIVRSGGCWKLTDSNPYDNGVMLAFLAWANNREFYALLGLKGLPLKVLWIKPANAGSNTERRGVQVESVGLD
jgi:hypothetical protein